MKQISRSPGYEYKVRVTCFDRSEAFGQVNQPLETNDLQHYI